MRLLKPEDLLISPLLWLIRLYQRTLSPDEGWLKIYFPNGYCRWQPHCSEYCYQALKRHGLIKGLILSSWRLLRCHPWAKGGFDPVK